MSADFRRVTPSHFERTWRRAIAPLSMRRHTGGAAWALAHAFVSVTRSPLFENLRRELPTYRVTALKRAAAH